MKEFKDNKPRTQLDLCFRRGVIILILSLALIPTFFYILQPSAIHGHKSVEYSDTGESKSCEQQHLDIHVVLSVDKAQFKGVLPLLRSIQLHIQNKSFTAHIVVSKKDKMELIKIVSCGLLLPADQVKVHIAEFDVPKSLKKLIRVKHYASLSSTANFARFYFYRIFPSLSYILYLDVDTLVMHDISELWKEVICIEELLVIVPRINKEKLGFHFLDKHYMSLLFRQRYGSNMSMSGTTYNAGILGFNLNKWRKNNIIREVMYWMTEHKKTPLWYLGTQPILYIVGYDDWKGVDSRWNVESLGWKKLSNETISNAYILHWNGPQKPWNKKGRYFYLWKNYDKGLCSRRGECIKNKHGMDFCICESGFKGKYCEINSTLAEFNSN